MALAYDEQNRMQLAVDCIIFGFDPEEKKLKLLLIKRDFEPAKGEWSLMGGFVQLDETLKEAAHRVLHELTGLKKVFMQQLKAFSSIERDPMMRTVSVAYFALVNLNKLQKDVINHFDATWFPIDVRPSLIFDHDEMVSVALDRLRLQATIQPIGFELLPEKFTMKQLKSLYEQISGESLDLRNFSKKNLFNRIN
jgi:8-oxo-dGTP diphosphatase